MGFRKVPSGLVNRPLTTRPAALCIHYQQQQRQEAAHGCLQRPAGLTCDAEKARAVCACLQGLHKAVAGVLPMWATPPSRRSPDAARYSINLPAAHPDFVQPELLQWLMADLPELSSHPVWSHCQPALLSCVTWFVDTTTRFMDGGWHVDAGRVDAFSLTLMKPYLQLMRELPVVRGLFAYST